MSSASTTILFMNYSPPEAFTDVGSSARPEREIGAFRCQSVSPHIQSVIGVSASLGLVFQLTISKTDDGKEKFRFQAILSGYSWRRAITGSTCMARRAGTKPARVATAARMNATAARVTGSCADTPKSKWPIKCAAANAHGI